MMKVLSLHKIKKQIYAQMKEPLEMQETKYFKKTTKFLTQILRGRE